MSELQNKSNELSTVAQMLHDEGLYAAVAHGAYYSCFQQVKHFWLYDMGKTEKDLEDLQRQNKAGVHVVLINEVTMYLNSNTSLNGRAFSNEMVQLKRLRVKADYENCKFDKDDSTKSLKLSAKIIAILKQIIL